MKILLTQDAITWFELKQIILTAEQQEIMQSGTDLQKREIITELNSKRKVLAHESDVAIAASAYEANKPILTATDVYQFIAADLTIDDNGKASGIINCRINGEHKQTRF